MKCGAEHDSSGVWEGFKTATICSLLSRVSYAMSHVLAVVPIVVM